MRDRLPLILTAGLASIGLAFTNNVTLARPEPEPIIMAQAGNKPSPDNQSNSSQGRQLKEGDEGEIILELQKKLKKLKLYEGTPNGKYDQKTKEAVSQFQKSNGLEPTGIFDTKTWEKFPKEKPKKKSEKKGMSRRALFFITVGGLATLVGLGGGFYMIIRIVNSNSAKSKFVELEPELEAEEESDKLFTPSAFVPPVIANGSDSFLSSSSLPHASVPNPSILTDSDRNYPDDLDSLILQHPSSLPQLDAVEELIRNLRDAGPEKRHKAIWELAQMADSRAVQPLVGLLLESDSQQQTLILEALSQIGTRTLKPMNRALALSLQDDNPHVRKNAIRDLTRIYETLAQLSQLVYFATDDPDPEVQETAKWALNQLSHIRMPGNSNNQNNSEV